MSLSVACQDASQPPSADQQQAAPEAESSTSSQGAPKEAKPQATAKADATPKAEAPSKAKPAHSEDTFEVYTPTQDASDILLIKSKTGYKINENYPHRATFSLGDKALKAQVGVELKTLSLSIPDANLAKPGTSVKASFSVCDDKSCKVYSKNYSW